MRINKLLGFCIMILVAAAGFAIAQTSINGNGGTIVNINFTNAYTANWHGYFGNVDLGSYGYNTTTLWKNITPTGGQIDYSSGSAAPHLGHLLISNSSTAPVVGSLTAGNPSTDLDPLITESFDNASLLFVNTSNYLIANNNITSAPTLYLYQNSSPSTVFKQVLLKDGADVVFAVPLYKTSKDSYNATNATYQYIVPKISGFQYTVYTYLENLLPYFNPALANQGVLEDSTLIYDVDCTDPDGDILAYYDDSLLFGIDSSTGLINWTPTNSDVGNHTITIYCQDVETNVTDSFVVEVNNTNDAPTITGQTITPTSPYTNDNLSCSWLANDIDIGDSLLYVNITWFNNSVQVNDFDVDNLFTTRETGLVDHLVISEINYDDDVNDDNEYVELFNPTYSTITIDSNWKIGDGEGNDTLCNAQIQPGGHYLIVYDQGNYVNISDCNLSTTIGYFGLHNTADSVRLYYGDTLIDGVGWGGETVEGSSAADVTDVPLVRTTKWIDSNNNSADFSAGTKSPQNTNDITQFPVLATNQSVLSSATSKGENWTCQITVFDSAGASNSYNTTTNILNTVPSVSGVNITPATAYSDSTLTGNYTFSDIDTDGDSSTYRWFKNGALVNETTQNLGPGNFTRADSIIFEVTPNDGETNGVAVNSSAVIISNTAPVMSYVNVLSTEGASAYENSTLTANVSASDIDSGDSVSYYYRWYNYSNLLLETTSSTLNGIHFNRGDNITLGVIPSDGIDNGTEMNSSNWFEISNSIPTVTVIIPNGSEIWSGTQNILWSANDNDNDSLTFGIYYYNSTDWITINDSIVDPSQYSYTWTLPNANLSGVLVNITVNDSIEFRWDVSDQTFNITEVDVYPPVVTFVSPTPNGHYTSQNVPLNITVNEYVGSSCYYELNNSINGNINGDGFAYNGVMAVGEEGSFNVSVYCNDTMNNTGSASQLFNVDTVVPQITIVSPTATLYSSDSITLNVSASEIVNCDYSLNGATNTSIISAATQNSTAITAAHGNNTINLYCTDPAGLQNNSESVAFTTDILNPANITDLVAVPGNVEGQINLNWTAPGDDNMTGAATSYTVKMSTSAINNQSDFDAATTVTQSMTPQAAGNEEKLNVTGLLTETTYYFAVVSVDDVGHTSDISNIASATTKNHDLGVDFISHSKENSTAYLYDQITISSNITNYGGLDETNVPIKLIVDDDYATPYSTQYINILASEIIPVNFTWNATQNGPIENRKVEVYADLTGDSEASNDKKNKYIQVYNLTKEVTINWLLPTMHPKPSSSGNETLDPFWVYVQLSTQPTTPNLKDLNLSVDIGALTINSVYTPSAPTAMTSVNADKTYLYSILEGNAHIEQPYWQVNAASGNYNIVVTLSTNDQNRQTISRPVSIS